MNEANGHSSETPKEEVFDFTKLDPHDGFKIKRSTVGNEISLHLTVRCEDALISLSLPEAGGEDTVELRRWPDAYDQVSLGEADRLQNVLEAVARYLTVGGDMPTLAHCLQRMQLPTLGGFVYPGWHYSRGETLYDPDADAVVVQHLFVANVDEGTLTPAVVWVENSFIDVTTLGRLTRAEEEVYRHDDAGVAGGDGEKTTLQLPAPENPE